MKGFKQRSGTDCNEEYFPVVKHATIKAFLTWAAHSKTKALQVDVKIAFLHGRQNDEERYMRQPESFKDVEKIDSICKLK